MASNLFGRTNEVFPSRWLRLVTPNDGKSIPDLVRRAIGAETVIDVSTNPALWGGHLRGLNTPMMTVGPFQLENAEGEQAAHDAVLANLIENLCALGRERIDFYFLRIARPLKESQISGALIALEEARQEGNVRFVGLAAENTFVAQGILHLHDAFEALLINDELPSAKPLRLLAKSRRMAIVTHRAFGKESLDGEAELFDVASESDVQAICGGGVLA